MRKAINYFLFILIFTLAQVSAGIDNAEYQIIIQENGNAIVAIVFEGDGKIDFPLPQDVMTIEIEGGLYVLENGSATIAIGTTKKAIVVYKTTHLTQKSNKEWKFNMELEEITNKDIIVTMPEEAIIKTSSPSAFIETGELTKLHFEDTNNMGIVYSFPVSPNGGTWKSKNLYWLIALIPTLLGLFYILKIAKTKKISARQEQIIQTLTKNEEGIVKLLLGSRKPLKRNLIEKKLGIAKSSLAATLNNLERKKILTIDKSYTTHTIKLNKWFMGQ